MTSEREREERRCFPLRRLLVFLEPAAKRGCVLDSQPAVAHPPSILLHIHLPPLCLSSSLSVSFVCVQKQPDVSFIRGLSSPGIQLFQRFKASPWDTHGTKSHLAAWHCVEPLAVCITRICLMRNVCNGCAEQFMRHHSQLVEPPSVCFS